MPDLSLADELEFESWPEEKKQLAALYLTERGYRSADGTQYDAGFRSGFERGKTVGFNLGYAKRAETDKR